MIAKLLDLVRKNIYELTGLPVVDTDDPVVRAEYPFFSYKVTTYIPDRHTGIHQNIASEVDITERLLLQPTLALSFNSYDKNLVKAHSNAITAWEWFKHIGKQDLKENGFVVTKVMAVNDRTIELSEEYEYRYGFDVMLRTSHTIDRTVTSIETWEINKEE